MAYSVTDVTCVFFSISIIVESRSNFSFLGKDCNILSLSCLMGTFIALLSATGWWHNIWRTICNIFHYMNAATINRPIEQELGETLSIIAGIEQKHS